MRDSKRDTDVKKDFWILGEGDGGMIWENSIETYITICKVDDQGKFNAWSRAVLFDNPEGWGGEGGGRGVQDGETHVHPWVIHVDVWQKPPQDCKVISLQLN